MRQFMAGVIVLLGTANLSAGTVYDAAADLTQASIDNGLNPNGVWSYGYRNTAASTEFALLPVHGQLPYDEPDFTGLKGWFDLEDEAGWRLPVVMKNTTDTPLVGGGADEIIVPPGGLVMHPYTYSTGQAYAVLRWTAPSSATADLAITFTGIDYHEADSQCPYTFFTTTDVHVIKNGLSVFEAEVTGGLYASTNIQSYSVRNMAVAGGDTIDFIVGPGPDDNFGADSTGISVQISVPEPSAFVLLGIGAVGLFAWHRRCKLRLHSIPALGIVLVVSTAHADVISIFPTGVDDSGNRLPGGSIDPHYWVLQTDACARVLSSANHWGDWPVPATGGQWINYEDSWHTTGTHTFRTTFDLTGFNPCSAILTGVWTGDNDTEVLLNGNPIGISVETEGFRSLFEFNITSGFQSGVNTLDFNITRMDDWDGLIVSEISGSAGAVPEPSSVMLLGIGVASVLAFAWRRRSFRIVGGFQGRDGSADCREIKLLGQ